MKSEIRNPKSEGRPKSEARNRHRYEQRRREDGKKNGDHSTETPGERTRPTIPFFRSSRLRVFVIELRPLKCLFGFRVSGFGFALLALQISVLLVVALTAGAATPAPEQILPDDTLILLTVPDCGKLHEIWQGSPRNRFWNDPAMKPLHDKFLSRWQEEVVKPLDQDLGLHLDAFTNLPKGQLTFAVTRNAWQGGDDQPLGFLLLLDVRDKADVFRTNLADMRKKWVSTGKTIKTEKIRDLEFSVFPFTTNDVPKTLSKFLWRPPVFPQVSGGLDLKQVPVSPSRKGDILMDTLTVLLTASKELVVGQVDSLLIIGNSVKGVEKIVIRLTGGATPTLGELAAYQASHQALFREAPFYGWVNVKAIVDTLARKSSDTQPPENPDPFELFKPEKFVSATGLGSCKTLAFNLQDSTEGSLWQFFLSVPEASRQGIFPVLPGGAKEASPPPFVPADAAYSLRWRIDGPKALAAIAKVLNDLSPQSLSAVNLILDTADARAKQTDPGFDLKKTLLANLGDDIVSYERAPRGNTPEELQSPPSIFLLGSPNPEQLAVALKRLFVIFPQGDAPAEREFLGRKIFSVPVPPLPFLMAGPSRPGVPRILSCAASGGYVAMSTDTPLIEEYLRSSESQAKALREKPGLLESAQKVGGMGTGHFVYENQSDAMRAAFESAKNDPGASTNGIGPSIFPGLPGIAGPEGNLNEWMDFSLLPPFDKVAQYFYSTIYAGSANVDGLTLKLFTPVPPALRSNTVVKPGN